ncbi:MAG: DUF5676 family membrane protein [Candidatus Woesearchaeota archaeon]
MEEKNLHYAHPAGIAAAVTGGIIYALCAFFVTMWPEQALSFFASWFHGIDLTKIAVPVQLTFGSFIVVLIETMVFFYLIGLIYGWFTTNATSIARKENGFR